MMSPLDSRMGTEIRLTIPFLLIYTWKSPYVPFMMVTIVPALHLTVIVASLSFMSVRNSSKMKVWYDAHLSR